MENPNQMHTAEPDVLLNDVPCCGNVCIPRSRYDELICAEMEREILFHAYQQMTAFNMGPVMDAIFNSKFKYKGSVGSAE